MWVTCIDSCGIPAGSPQASTDSVFVLATEQVSVPVGRQGRFQVADREMLAILSDAFYRDQPDEFDMLVFWGSAAMAPASAYFLPVRNDVAGIGYGNVGAEFFDDSGAFGSERLQGIIWMGTDWITHGVGSSTNSVGADLQSGSVGPDSVLGVLAQETAHRWGATIHFRDGGLKASSDELLGSPFHWSFLLDTDASPLRGNAWLALGNGLFRADPVEAVRFSSLDLYLMGLLNPEEVGPIRLLRNARGIETSFQVGTGLFSRQGDRVRYPVTVRAELVEISIDQVIEVEGSRVSDPQSGFAGSGFTAAHIRQAWIFVSDTAWSVSPTATDRLRDLASDWPPAFAHMTGGRGSVSVTTGRARM